MSKLNQTILTRDGLRLTRRQWLVSQPRGTVVLAHGIAEHSGRYEHVAAQLNGWGWSVQSYDHRGHGRSEGACGALCRDDDLVHDLAAVMAAVRAEQPELPLLLMGHSMGGLVAACYVADLLEPRSPAGFTDVDGLILSSPALEVNLGLGQKLLMSSLARLLPDLLVRTGFDPKAICRDPAVVQAYKQDPLVHDRISGRLGRFIVEGGGYVRALAEQWIKPTLLMYAGSDEIVSPQGSVQFAQKASSVVQSQCFAHMAHEILNEPDQAQVFHAMRLWLDDRFAREAPYGLRSLDAA
ncbi:MAG: alpha/beta hydrolase [Aquabacterium sp.]|uniref:alpha/beta hydrolase n=1 Tax=Aquabacterium sp. TaxID=1872578 RepID=UPI0012293B2C|nr:alpha/beta hydrolase [Aquabacterium sp.]TAK93255.1 MAG: alpha/beta hydrolase [Aquabacterium sp.]